MPFLPGSQDLPLNERHHHRLTRAGVVMLLSIGTVFALDYLLRDQWLAALLNLVFVMVLSAALITHTRSETARLTVHLGMGCYIVATLGISINIGNFTTPLTWLLLVPLVSGTLLEAREMLAWSLLALITVLIAGLLAPPSFVTVPAFHAFHLTGMLLTITLLVFWVLQEHARSRLALQTSQAELRELANQLIRTEERTRNSLVTDLHEGVLQEIFALRLFLTAAGSDELDRSLEQLDRIDSQLRSLVVSLHPEIPNQASLGEALAELVARAPTHLGLNITLKAPPLPRLPDVTEKALFLTTRELLFNAARYARTDTVRLRLVLHTALLMVHIEDDGIGFSPSERSASGSGIGLRLCQERIQSIGGRMVVDSTPGQGTHITLVVPIPVLGSGDAASG